MKIIIAVLLGLSSWLAARRVPKYAQEAEKYGITDTGEYYDSRVAIESLKAASFCRLVSFITGLGCLLVILSFFLP